MWRRDDDGRMMTRPHWRRWNVPFGTDPKLPCADRVEGERSQDVDDVAADIWEQTDREEADGFTDAGRGLMELSIVAGCEDLGAAAAKNVGGGARPQRMEARLKGRKNPLQP